MDDTIENLLEAWLTYLNSKHGTTIFPQDVISWNVSDYFPQLTAEQV